jgi:membrane dipeptidase
MRLIAAALLLALPLTSPLAAGAQTSDAALKARVDKVLQSTPLIDGHNDLPWEIRERAKGKVDALDLRQDTAHLPLPASDPQAVPLMTDIPRLRAGHVGGQFWSVWTPPNITGPIQVKMTLEQIDIVKGMAERYPETFEMAYTAEDVVRIHKAGRIACMIGIEGGHQIDDSLPVLRQYYAAGARYMTLAHAINNHFADSATADPEHNGLTPFGKAVVREMNRMGMMVDLSHVSEKTMRDALAVTAAPVIFSHSGSRAVDEHMRNVPDGVLTLVAANRGVVMVNFTDTYVSEARNHWDADLSAEKARYNAPPFGGLYIGQPEKAKAAIEAWEKAHPAPAVTLAMVADHIEHIAKVCGVDCVGIGSDFDGTPVTPTGLEDVSKYPALLVELARRGWSDGDLAKVAGGNVLRVMHEAEIVAHRLQKTTQPSYATLADLDGKTP